MITKQPRKGAALGFRGVMSESKDSDCRQLKGKEFTQQLCWKEGELHGGKTRGERKP